MIFLPATKHGFTHPRVLSGDLRVVRDGLTASATTFNLKLGCTKTTSFRHDDRLALVKLILCAISCTLRVCTGSVLCHFARDVLFSKVNTPFCLTAHTTLLQVCPIFKQNKS